MRRHVSMILVFVVFVTFATSCKSTKEYANLAQAGTTYAAAMDRLLIATQEIDIDTNSERLLQDDALTNLSLEKYRNLSSEDEKLLKLITLLRQHVKLLSRYFGLLYELATSNAPERAQKAIGSSTTGVIGNLNKVSAELRGSGFVPSGLAAAAGPITSAIVSAKIRSALKNELNLRKETIQEELVLQEELLKVLSDRITHDLTLIQMTREQRLVIEPLISKAPIAKPDEWINNRRSILTMSLAAQELKTASTNITKLREAFEDLMSGKLTLDRVNSLLADFDSLLTIAEKLRS